MAEVVAELMEGKRSIEFIAISSASTLSFPPQRTFPIALHRRRQCCRRTSQEGLNCSTARAWGRWHGGRRPSGATAHSAFLPAMAAAAARFFFSFFFACGLDSSPPPRLTLSWCTYACVCRGGRAFSFVRSPFLLVFRLYLFLIARSSSSFLLRSISFSLFPFFAPYVIIGSLGPSETGAGAGGRHCRLRRRA